LIEDSTGVTTPEEEVPALEELDAVSLESEVLESEEALLTTEEEDFASEEELRPSKASRSTELLSCGSSSSGELVECLSDEQLTIKAATEAATMNFNVLNFTGTPY